MSNPFDRLLVNPDENTLVLALEEACRQEYLARWQCGRRQWQPILAEMADEAEGREQWEEDALYLVVIWWTDYQGSRHVRVCSGYSKSGRHLHSSRMDEDLRPPLWHVYPERIFHVHRAGQGPVWLASCACGMTGPWTELAWMGPCCGPCHDRFEDGESPSFAKQPAMFYPSAGPIDALAFSPDGETLATSSIGPRLDLHDLRDGSKTNVFGGEDEHAYDGFRPIAFSPEGRILAASDSEDLSMRLWPCDPLLQEAIVLPLEIGDPSVQVTSLAFSRDGEWLAVCLDNQQARVWRRGETGWRRSTFRPRVATVVAFSPDNHILAVGVPTGRVRLYNTNTWDQVSDIVTGASTGQEVLFLEYCSDGASLVLITGSTELDHARFFQLRQWDLARNYERRFAHIPVPSAVASSPDGRFLAWIIHDPQHSPSEIIFWDLRTWQEAGRLQWNPEDDLRTLAFAPDNQTLATGSSEGVVKIIPWRFLLQA